MVWWEIGKMDGETFKTKLGVGGLQLLMMDWLKRWMRKLVKPDTVRTLIDEFPQISRTVWQV